MRVSQASLRPILQNNVAEIKFMRRRPKMGFAPTRRMLCTSSLALLNSPQGRIALNFRPAYGRLSFNPDIKDLLIVWDIFMQDYRLINMKACEMLQVVPVKDFWKFFNEKLALLTPQQKIAFMNQ